MDRRIFITEEEKEKYRRAADAVSFGKVRLRLTVYGR